MYIVWAYIRVLCDMCRSDDCWDKNKAFQALVILKAKEFLYTPVQQPEVAHFCGAYDSVVHYPYHGRGIEVDWSGRLWVAQLLKGYSEYLGFLGVVEECPKLGFGCLCCHKFSMEQITASE